MQLQREIGFIGASVLVLNGLIGAGIFALPDKMMAQLGSFSPWVFPIFGVLMLSIVWCIAALSARFQQTGGPVLYANSAFGPLTSFQTGWLFYLARATAIAANAHVLTLYLSYLLPETNVPTGVIVVIVCVLLTLINYAGIKRAMMFLDGMTIIKITPIVLLVLYALSQADFSTANFEPPAIDNLGTAALLTLYAFIGFETVVVTSGETQNPKRTLPTALLIIVIATAIFYCLVQFAYVSVMQDKTVTGAPLIAFANELAGNYAAVAISLAAIFSIAANVLANMISTSRLTFAMAEEQEIPGWFAHIHPKYATPDHSILFLGALACLLSLTGGFVWLAVVSVLSRMLIYLVCIVSLLKLKKAADWPRSTGPLASVIALITPYIAIAVILLTITQSSWQAWAMLTGQFLIGLCLYFVWQRRKSQHATE